MITRNDPCWCGSGSKWKKCHYPQQQSLEKDKAAHYLKQYGIILKTPEQIEGIRKACSLTAFVLDEVCKAAKKGVTTNALDKLAYDLTIEAGAQPAPLGYGSPPYPKSICTSLNDEICHGIPNDIPLKEGDIMNIDVSCILNGYYGDSSRMVIIGKTTPEKKNVVEASKECLKRSIEILKPGLMLFEIGDAIEDCAAEYGCSVVNIFVGHGVGLEFHEAPQVAHHRNDTRIPLEAGMTFTIEPMINAGVREGYIGDNDWTAYTADGKPSAQWEHTLLITDTGYEILTAID